MNKKKINLIIIAILVVAIASVFVPVLLSDKSLWGPDDMAHASVVRKLHLPTSMYGLWLNSLCGIRSVPYGLVPGGMLLLFLPPLLAHVFAYIFDVILLIFAMFFLLRGFKIKGPPLYIAALAMGLSFHSFTIISAGHLGKFHMMPMAVFMLAFLDRAIKQRSLFYFALTGLAAGFGITAQADVMFVFALLGAAYGVYRFVTEWPKEKWIRYCSTVAIGVAIAGIMFFAITAVSLKSLTGNTLGSRAELSGNTPEQKWEFATNWSLPPEDMLEFITPCVRGIETSDPQGPYWGRLGQTKGWMTHHQGLRNLRQHTVYLGVLQLVFALFAIVVVFSRRKDAEEDDGLKNHKGEVIFWSGVFIVAVLMALGRYFPLYKLFYMLPYASSMRAPVKFMHVVEVSLAILFAFGLEGIFVFAGKIAEGSAKDKQKSRRIDLLIWCAIGSAVIGVILFISAISVGGKPAWLVGHWQAMGFGNIADLLADNMSAAFVHGALLFLFVSVVFWAVKKFGGAKWMVAWLPIVIMLVLAADLLSVDKKYVKTKDLSMFFDSNVLIDKLKSDSALYRLSCPMNNPPFQQWKTFMFQRHLIDCLEPSGQMRKEYIPYFTALQSNIVRLWQLTNSKYILGPTSWTDNLLKNNAFKLVMSFNMDRRGGIIPAGYSGGQVSLVEFKGALPRVLVYYNWKPISEENAIAALTDKHWNPGDTLLVNGDIVASDGNGAPVMVKSILHKPQKVTVTVDLKKDGILLLNDKYDPDWRVFVDGKEGEVLECNAIMRGVKVPAGKHKVVFTYHPYLKQFIVSLIALVVMISWGILRGIRKRLLSTDSVD